MLPKFFNSELSNRPIFPVSRGDVLKVRLINNYQLAKQFIDEKTLDKAFIAVTQCKNDLIRLIFLAEEQQNYKNWRIMRRLYKQCLIKLKREFIYYEPKIFSDILAEALLIIKQQPSANGS